MKEQIKQLRVRIDGLYRIVNSLTAPIRSIDMVDVGDMPLNEIKELMTGSPMHLAQESTVTYHSSELEQAANSLRLAKAWLGELLGSMGEESPYKNDGNRKSVEDIEIETDTFPSDMHDTSGRTHVEIVDWLTEEIKGITKEMSSTDWGLESDNGTFNELILDSVYRHLKEARFWLGFELGRIRNAQ